MLAWNAMTESESYWKKTWAELSGDVIMNWAWNLL